MDKQLPHDKELEEEILAIVLLFPGSVFKIIKWFKPQVFYDSINQEIVKAILQLIDEGVTPDHTLTYHRVKKNTSHEYREILTMNNASSPTDIQAKYFILVEFFVKREIIRIGQEAIIAAQDPMSDFVDVYEDYLAKLQDLHKFTEKEKSITNKEVLENTFNNIFLHYQGDIVSYYKTGNEKFDSILQINGKNILLAGGKSGTGKTKFLTALITGLLRNNDDVSVLWYSMEDPADKIVRCFISMSTKLSDSQILSKDYKMSQSTLDFIIGLRDKFNSYDIEFVETASKVKSIKSHFASFCKKRPDRLNILVVDNLAILEDNNEKGGQTEKDDRIALGFQNIMNETKGLVILIHHFTDAQMEKGNFSNGYRPRETHLKGSTRYRDISTQILLINKPSEYPDVRDYYKDKEYLNYLFITDIVKNRNNNKGLIRWYADLASNTFLELNAES